MLILNRTLKEIFDKRLCVYGKDKIPIILLKRDSYIGIAEDGYWYVDVSTGIRELKTPKDYLFIESVLEIPINILCGQLQTFIRSNDIEIDIFDFFPFVEVAGFPIEQTKSDYWIDLSLKWIKVFPYKQKIKFIKLLDELVDDKAIGQQQRHKAREILKEILA